MKLAKDEQMLNPLQTAVFHKNNDKLDVLNINDEEYVSWYKGYLNFKSKNLAAITKKLERYFNVEIKLDNPRLETKVISGKLKLEGEDIDTVIKVLANTASLSLEKINETTYVIK